MKNAIALLFCLLTNQLYAQITIQSNAQPIQGNYSEVGLYGDLSSIQSVEWIVDFGLIVAGSCTAEYPTAYLLCDGESVDDGNILIQWDCDLNNIPSVMAIITDTLGNETTEILIGQSYTTPSIMFDEGGFCMNETSVFSVDLIDNNEHDYVWMVTGDAAYKTDITTKIEDGKSVAYITWGAYGDAEVSLLIILGSDCKINTTYNNPIMVKDTPDPPVINGSEQVCSVGTVNYTISPQMGVVEYEWILPLYAKSYPSSEVRITTTTPNLTVKFDEEFRQGDMKVIVRNSCGGEASSIKTLYNGNPALKIPIEGQSLIKGAAERAYIFNAPGANWYEWRITGPDSSMASIITNPNQSKIYLNFNEPTDTITHFITLEARAYEQQGSCPLTVATQQLRIQACDQVVGTLQDVNFNHDDLIDALNNENDNGYILGRVLTRHCICAVSTAKKLNIVASLDIRCPDGLDDKDYMFGSSEFNLVLNAKMLLYDISGGLLAAIPFSFNVTPQSPKQAFAVIVNGANYGITSIEDVAVAKIKVIEYNFTGTEIDLKEDCINFNLYFDYDYTLDVKNTTVELLPVETVQVNNKAIEATFKWKLPNTIDSQCPIDNYEFQLLKLIPKNLSDVGTNPSIPSTEHTFNIGNVDWTKALTIETQSSHKKLTLTLTEGNGPYFWRVRPIGNVQRNGAGNDDNWGIWSNDDLWIQLDALLNTDVVTVNNGCLKVDGSVNCLQTTIDGDIVNIPACFDVNQFDDDKNWIYSRTFAEGNTDRNEQVRIGEQISYANGLLQPIQTQSQLTQTPGSPISVTEVPAAGAEPIPVTNDIVVASQTLYDYSGRAALQSIAAPVAPIPVEPIIPGVNTLGYRNDVLPANYNTSDFDNGAAPSVVDEGQINTYFDSTIDPQIPSTEGLPFSRTLFYNDGTSRVLEQGGVGSTFQVGSGHTSRTSYASASDDELIRLFGDEAPSSKNVYKVTQTDPNGVQSISYIDLSGKTIATCLAGNNNATGALLPIDESSAAQFNVVQNLTDNIGQGEGDNLNIVSSTTVTLTEATDMNFAYTIDLNSFSNTCMNWCATCQYHLKVVITPVNPIGATMEVYSDNFSIQNACDASDENTVVTFSNTPNLPAGTYTITKYLEPIGAVLNQPVIDTPPLLSTSINPISTLATALETQSTIQLSNTILGNVSSLQNPPFTTEFIDNLPTDGFNNVTVAGIISFLNDVAAGNINDSDNPNPPLGADGNPVPPTATPDSPESMYLFYEMLHVFANTPIIGCSPSAIQASYTDNGLVDGYQQATITINGYGYPYNFDWAIVGYVRYEITYVGATATIIIYYNSTATWAVSVNNADYSGSGVTIDQTGAISGQNATTAATVIAPTATNDSYTIQNCDNPCLTLNIPIITCPPSPCSILEAWKSTANGTNPYAISANPFFKDFVDYWTLHKDEIDQTTSYGQNAFKSVNRILNAITGQSFTATTVSENGLSINILPTFNYTVNDPLSLSLEDLNDMLSDLVDRATGTDYTCDEIWNCWQSGVHSYAQQMMAMAEMETNPPTGLSMNNIPSSADFPTLPDGFPTPPTPEDLEELGGLGTDTGDNIAEQLQDADAAIGSASLAFDFVSNYFDCIGYYPNDPNNPPAEVGSPSATELVNTLYLPNATDDYLSALTTCLQAAYLTYFPNNALLILSFNISNINDIVTLLNTLPTDFSISPNADAEALAEIRHAFYECYAQQHAGATPISSAILGTMSINAPFDIYCQYDNNGSTITIDVPAGGSISLLDYMAAMNNCPVENLPSCPYTYQYFKNYLLQGLYDYEGFPEYNNFGCNECVAEQLANFFLSECANPFTSDYNNIAAYIHNISGYQISVNVNHGEGPCAFSENEFPVSNNENIGHFYLFGHCNGANLPTNLPLPYPVIGDCLVPCTPPSPSCQYSSFCITFTKIPTGPQPNPHTCNDFAAADVVGSIQQQIQQIAAAQAQQLTAAYSTQCTVPANIHDRLTLSYTLTQQQYTLYYYDRAGNLIKTVPPEGVAPLQALTDANVQNRQVSPQHSMVTDYQYNNLGQVLRQHTPDGGTTKFWRNLVGLVRFSQNDKQATNVNGITPSPKYSYTKYDKLARVIEVGQVAAGSIPSGTLDVTGYLAASATNAAINGTETGSFPIAGREQIVRTFYTTPFTDITLPEGRTQRFLQNRVSYTYFAETEQLLSASIDNIKQRHYTIYSYDVHGNVEWLCQYIAVPNANLTSTVLFTPKFIDYQYDLLSGKVLQVAYNKGQPDQYFHRYTYDAQNRLTTTETSKDGLLWDNDATYTYYPHGPLRRTEIGDDHLQGLDYTYTAQGWLKAFNSPMLTENPTTTPPTDPYKDGNLTDLTAPRARMFPPDTYGMQLHYFNGDFINGSSSASSIEQIDAATTNLNSLYNGNIAAWTERGIQPTFTAPATSIELDQTLQYRYQYDLLNRIKQNTTYSLSGTTYALLPNSPYNTTYSFDRNGNVKSLTRNANTAQIDNFTYTYPAATIGDETRTNRLNTLTDSGSGTGNDNFIGTTNYTYDAIGNVTSESNATMGNTQMSWTPYGKISTVSHTGANATTLPFLRFAYDAAQNRIRQDETIGGITTSTLYVRDAQGNPMAMYKQTPLATSTITQLTEQPIYGSSRLGIQNSNLTVQGFTQSNGANLAPPNPPTYLPETTHLLFGLVPKLFKYGPNYLPHEMLGFMNTPNPVFKPFPTTEVTSTVSYPTNSQSNIGLAENTDGSIGVANVLGTNNTIVGISSNETTKYITSTSSYDTYSQNTGVPLPTSIPNTYLVFTIKDAKLYYFTVNPSSSIATPPTPTLVPNITANNYDQTLSVVADYQDANSPKIYVFLRQQMAAAGAAATAIPQLVIGTTAQNAPLSYQTQMVRITITPNAIGGINSGGVTSTNIGSLFPSYQAPAYKYLNTQSEIQVSPDGRFLATPNVIGKVIIGDLYLTMNEIRLYNIAVTPNVYIGSTYTGGGGSLPIAANNFMRSIDFSPSGQYIYAVGRNNNQEKTYRAKLTTIPISEFEEVNSNLFSSVFPLSSVRRGKNGNMYVAYAGQTATTDQILEIANPDQATTPPPADQHWLSIPNNRKLRGSISIQPLVIYRPDPKATPTQLLATQARGSKQYELTDHLGNIRTVVPDIKEPLSLPQNQNFRLPTLTLNNYYPYGMLQAGRSKHTDEYRFGFQGQEADNKIGGLGQHTTAQFWEYDTWAVKRWNVDPVTYPWHSGYTVFNGNPLIYKDPDGQENIVVVGGADVAGKDREKFFNTGLKALNDYANTQHKEKTTLVVMTAYMTEVEKAKLVEIVHDMKSNGKNVDITFADNAKELTNYFNYKNVLGPADGENNSSMQQQFNRSQDKVTDVSMFGHGYADETDGPTFEPGHYNGSNVPPVPTNEHIEIYHDNFTWGISDALQLNQGAFNNPKWNFETCNASTECTDFKSKYFGKSLAGIVSERTQGTATGYFGKSEYSGIYNYPASMTLYKSLNGRIHPSPNYPKEGVKNDRSGSSEKITYKKGEKQ